jgi:hypothetical protein
VITLRVGATIEADDARVIQDDRFIEYIARSTHVRNLISTQAVAEVRKVDLGEVGGMRFTGQHDASFARTDGSV